MSFFDSAKSAAKGALAVARDPVLLRQFIDLGQRLINHQTNPGHLGDIVAAISGAVALGTALAGVAVPQPAAPTP